MTSWRTLYPSPTDRRTGEGPEAGLQKRNRNPSRLRNRFLKIRTSSGDLPYDKAQEKRTYRSRDSPRLW